jgi:hypothetical protein
MLPLVGPENPGNRAIGRVGGGRSEPAQRGKGKHMADFVKAFVEDQKAAEVLRMQREDKQNERMFSLLAQALGPTGSWTAKEEEKGFAVTWSRCWWLGAERRGHGGRARGRGRRRRGRGGWRGLDRVTRVGAGAGTRAEARTEARTEALAEAERARGAARAEAD